MMIFAFLIPQEVIDLIVGAQRKKLGSFLVFSLLG
jgi:hypothetical protein